MDLSQRLANLSPKQRELLQKRLQSATASAEPIAIVGMSCRFPGAPDLDAYWRLISEGRDGTSDIPRSRWDVDSLYDPTGTISGKMSVRRAGLVDNIDQFDPKFFGISPREASRMDPQQRLLLEVSWEALEVASIRADSVAGTPVGVFVGIGGTDYSKVPSSYDGYYQYIDAHVGTGNALSIAANRVSYIMDLRGPSMAIDTACSSSTMAIHLAIASLRSRECNLALTGGVNAILTPETTIAFSKARMLSPDGVCRPFDASANGYVRGEGCGMLAIKRLADAIADGDPIYGVIRASATNQDGRTSGITAPNGVSQQAVIRTALAQAGFTPDRVDHIEAHGTGTPLGDPIEIDALTHVFRRNSANDKPCTVTSVKANVGHMETVSGVAGIIKVLLMMRYRQIPGQLHLKKLNPSISLKNSRLVISPDASPWPTHGDPFVAGVSSFGFGGANTHLILEQYTAQSKPADAPEIQSPVVVTVSGHSAEALAESARRWRDHLPSSDSELVDFATTTTSGRIHFNYRAAMVCENVKQLAGQLDAIASGTPQPHLFVSKSPVQSPVRIAMMFTGQGSQSIDMGRRLMQSEPVFRDAMLRCDELLRGHLPEPLLSVIYPDDFAMEGSTHDVLGNGTLKHVWSIDETQYTQPALFAIEYALSELWKSWGITPSVVLGHSVGEYVAMVVAGCVSLEDGLRLIAARATGMQAMPGGGKMVAVLDTIARVESLMRNVQADLDRDGQKGVFSIAAVNGPENIVVSGDSQSLDRLIERCVTEKIRHQPLKVSHAFHSKLMEPMLAEFRGVVASCAFHRPKMPLIANLTGELLQRAPDAEMLCRHITDAVQFEPSMRTMAEMKLDVVIESGPAPVLIGMGRRCLPESTWTWLPSLRPGQDDAVMIRDSLCQLEIAGADIQWKNVSPVGQRQSWMPTAAFQRSRFWLDPSPEISGDHRTLISRVDNSHPLLGRRVPSALTSALFENTLSISRVKFLADHAVQGSVNMPAAGFLEIALAAASELFGDNVHRIEDFSIDQAMFLPSGDGENGSRLLHTTVDDTNTIEIRSIDPSDPNAEWIRHAHGRLIPGDDSVTDSVLPNEWKTFEQRIVDTQQHDEFYDIMTGRRLQYGPAFRMMSVVERSSDEARGTVACDPSVQAQWSAHRLHPVLGDALMQTFSALVPREPDGSYSPYTYVPTRVTQAKLLRPIDGDCGSLTTYGRRTSTESQPSPESVEGDMWLLDGDGNVVAQWLGVEVRRVGHLADEHGATKESVSYLTVWEPVDAPEKSASSIDCNGSIWWLIGGDDEPGNLVDHFAKKLKSSGAVVITTRRDFRSSPMTVEECSRHLQQIQASGPLTAIVDARALSLLPVDVGQADWDAVESQADQLTALFQSALRHVNPDNAYRGWWILTDGAVAATENDRAIHVAQSPLWGLMRVAALEHPPLRPTMIDLQPGAGSISQAQSIWDHLVTQPAWMVREDQIAIRTDGAFVARLRSAGSLAKSDSSGASNGLGRVKIPPTPYRLRFATEGSFDSLYFESCQRRVPGEGEIELKIDAAGLNFSDVLKAMGLYPGITDPVVPLGIECSGVVTAVGKGVKTFAVGDPVMGVAPFSFGSHAITPAYTLMRRPDCLDAVQAASIPIAFMTAWHGLIRLADMQPGERVLIHAGAGGVGLAAIQIAQLVGAEVFATAGSESKREFLRSLGVKHVFDSRSTAFADQIRQVTDGEGIDIVLNSLPGDAINKSLGILRAYGRFLEIGKTDIYQNRSIGLLPFRDNLSYHAIDLDRVLRQRPDVIAKLLTDLADRFASGQLQPTVCTDFDATQITDAFRYMAQRKNIGKVVVRMSTAELADAPETQLLEPAASTTLITGGTGALGLRIAEELIARSSSYVALLTRREPDEEVRQLIQRWNQTGHVVVLRGDVSDRQSLQKAFADLPTDFPPLGTIIHAAGVLDDGLLMDMTPQRLRRVLAAKVRGTWNLHEATLSMPIENFVLFSSIASTLGSPGQSNYAAGNRFLDAMAHHRRSLGLPALCIAWGPWADSGMAASEGRDQQLQSRGMRLIDPEFGLSILWDLMQSDVIATTIMDIDWSKMLNQMPIVHGLLSEFESERSSSGSPDKRIDREFLDSLEPLSDDERTSRLRVYFATELARLMGWEADQINPAQPLSQLGMDSLIAMELKSNLEQKLDLQIPMAALVESPSIDRLVASVGRVGVQRETQTANPGAVTCLLSLKSTGTQTPWVLVPPLGGSLSCYNELVQNAGEDRPIWGLLGQGSDGSVPPPSSLDAMLDQYVGEIQARIDDGPIHLLGWSAGGIFGLSLADRLSQAGRSIASVTLIDTPLPSIYANVDPADSVSFLVDFVQFSNVFLHADMRITEARLRAVEDSERYELVLAEAQRNGLLPSGASIGLVQGLVATASAHVRMIKAAELPNQVPSIRLVRPADTSALEGVSGQDWSGSLGWPEALKQTIDLLSTPGDHFSMLTGDHAASLVQSIESMMVDSLQQSPA